MLGYQADLAYNIALCHFKLKQFGPALKFIMEIIEVRPEFPGSSYAPQSVCFHHLIIF